MGTIRPMHPSFFRELDEDEEEEFRKYARENYTAGEEIKTVWHPVVKLECLRIYAEALGVAL